METTEEVSSDDPVKRVKRLKYQRSALVARGKRTADHKTGLQNCRTGRKSGKHPTLVVGQKPYGKSRLNVAHGDRTSLIKGQRYKSDFDEIVRVARRRTNILE